MLLKNIEFSFKHQTKPNLEGDTFSNMQRDTVKIISHLPSQKIP